MSVVSHSLTYADLLRERETRDERLELIEGEIVVTPAPAPLHQVIAHRLAVMLDQAIDLADFGVIMQSPLKVFFEDHTVVQPDLAVLLRNRMDQFGPQKVEGAPSLAVEILSPSTSARDQGVKRELYARHGVPEYWLDDPEAQTITIFSNPQGDQYQRETVTSATAVSATIPELSVDLKALFAPVPGI
ncbi:MAG: Uma2 family endonuclease [Chloroflexi bacterium]|nr:Uma2 family endonuclease [Chloroflexota bacterium]